VTEEYEPPPLYVHESGGVFPDVRGPDGTVDDRDRIDYLESHLRAARAAMASGVDLRGYSVWSLLDNFEWAEGYRYRFGIVHVDFDTMARTPKASAHWYAAVAAAGALVDPAAEPR
jgi:beta-glucosidase